MARYRSREAETEDVNQRRLQRGAVKRQHLARWAVGHDELAPGVIGPGHLQPTVIETIRDVSSGSGVGQLLVVSATAQSFASGGAYVTADSIVYQHGFDRVTAAGDSIVWPVDAVGEIQVEFAWSSFTGGGTIEVEVDGVVPAWGIIASGAVGQKGCGRRSGRIREGAVVKVKVTQSSGGAVPGDVYVEFAILDPSRPVAWAWDLLETVWLETRNNQNATTTATLTAGQAYRFVIEGNYDPWDGGGPTDFEVVYPSTVPSMGGQRDADTGGNHSFHEARFKIDLGSGAAHLEPVDGQHSTPTDGHVYEYLVTGQGSQVTFDHGDDFLSDNNGRFKIDIYRRHPST